MGKIRGFKQAQLDCAYAHLPKIAFMVKIIPHHFRPRNLSSSICKASTDPRVPKVSSIGCAMAFLGAAMEEMGLLGFLTMAEACCNLGCVEC